MITLKTIKLEASAWHSSHKVDLHETSYWDYSNPSTRNGGDFSPPKLKVQAIGEENIVYNLTNQYSITEGQVLETLAGVCDGRTVTVSSGIYTLENVTTKQDGTGTFVALTGSTIDYKPPPGTRQVIYELNFHVSYDTSGGTSYRHFHQKFMFNNTEVSAFNETYEAQIIRDGH